MLEPWKIGKVIRIENETHSTRRYWIEIPEIQQFDFLPGQFVTLDLPIHEQKNKRWRSYSIASAPDGTNVIELVIVLLEGGAGTTYLFNHVSVGSEISLRGPLGKFTLPNPIEKDIFLVCTGTGIAPFRSMIHYLHNNNIQSTNNIHIIFGCRTYKDALYKNELEALQKKLPFFFYHPVFSREPEVSEGEDKGYVHAVYEKLIQEKKQPSHFYLCGWKNMIDEAKERIISNGYDRKDIHLELYG
ncbi:MAG: FAD-dependent oxidoreductase [Chitinophagaceae bacterium]|nr:FAD-dependent oxidoreductase [Chitinophagaceae bacterium]MCW5904599.1 FAD-dependent oxidoreductase [Chitinophagaceae bacterium]